MRRGITLCGAAALAGMILASAPMPVAAFETHWFTQRGKNLRAGAGEDDDPALRRAPRQRVAPAIDRCGQGGGGQFRGGNDAPRGGDGCQ